MGHVGLHTVTCSQFLQGQLVTKVVSVKFGVQNKIESLPELAEVTGGPVVKALQIVRSTPFVLTAIVGHKSPGHVQKNTDLARRPLLTPDEFARVEIALAGGSEAELESVSR